MENSATVSVENEKNGYAEEEDSQPDKDERELDSPVEKLTDQYVSPTASPVQKREQSSNKLTVLFHATGNSPILRKRRWLMERSVNMACLSSRLRKLLKLTPADSLFLYVNQAFAPALDTVLSNLFDCFGAEGILNIHYCTTPAWG